MCFKIILGVQIISYKWYCEYKVFNGKVLEGSRSVIGFVTTNEVEVLAIIVMLLCWKSEMKMNVRVREYAVEFLNI